MNVLASLTVLGLLIFFHESGHFLAATLQGIRVKGFSIGFGPALFQKKISGVMYSFRVLPLGGFVSFPDNEQDISFPIDLSTVPDPISTVTDELGDPILTDGRLKPKSGCER